MCLGIPGQVVELLDPYDTAVVDVSGVRRVVNVGLVLDEPVEVGQWVLIHVGFAIAKIDEREAALTMEAFRTATAAYDSERIANSLEPSVSSLEPSSVNGGSRH